MGECTLLVGRPSIALMVDPGGITIHDLHAHAQTYGAIYIAISLAPLVI